MTKIIGVSLKYIYFPLIFSFVALITSCVSLTPIESNIETHQKPANTVEPFSAKVTTHVVHVNTPKVSLMLESPRYPNYKRGFRMYIWNENIKEFETLVAKIEKEGSGTPMVGIVKLGITQWSYMLYRENNEKWVHFRSYDGEFLFSEKDLIAIVALLEKVKIMNGKAS